MIDRWYYTHAGQTFGPVETARLRQLAAAGQLSPTDLIWPDGRDRSEAIEAQAALDFSTPAAPLPNKPDWLDDLRAVETKKPAAPPKTKPDWLEDVRAAEEEEQAFLTLEFDAEPSPAEAEPVEVEPVDVELVEGEVVEALAEVVEPEAGVCRLAVGSATSRGRVRDRNEDSLLVQQCTWGSGGQRHDFALVVVADGMGGHQAGDRASGLVIRTLGDTLAPLLTAALSASAPPPEPKTLAEALDRGLLEANRIVLQTAKDNPACKGMGSTAVALLIWDGHAFISLVGDCRVYHWRAGTLTQVTRDQTLVARMVELGQLTPQEAVNHPRRNEVTQAIGKPGRVEPARYELPLAPGDWLLASCDGLYAHVDDRLLGEEIGKAGLSATALANRLVDLANQGGGSDNCTVVAVQCV